MVVPRSLLRCHFTFPKAVAAIFFLVGIGCRPPSQSEQKNFCETRSGPTGADEVVATFIIPVPLLAGAAQSVHGSEIPNKRTETSDSSDTGFCFYERINDSDLRPLSRPLQNLIPGAESDHQWLPLTSEELFNALDAGVDKLLAAKQEEAKTGTSQVNRDIEKIRNRLGWVRHGPAAFATISLMATVFFGQMQVANFQYASLYAETHNVPAPSLSQLPEYARPMHAITPFTLISFLPAVPIISGAQIAGEFAASRLTNQRIRRSRKNNKNITVEALEELSSVPESLRLKLQSMLKNERYLEDLDELQTMGLVYQMFQAILVQKHLDKEWTRASQGRGYCPSGAGTAFASFNDRELWKELLSSGGTPGVSGE